MRGRLPHRHCAALVAGLLAAIAASPAHAAENVQVRAALHDGFGRMAFEWPAPVRYATHLDGDKLIIHFTRPLAAKLDVLPARLKPYLASASLADDGTTVVARLKKPVQVNAFTVHDSIVAVDLKTIPAAPPVPPPAPAIPTRKPEPDSAAGPALSVKIGTHKGLRRLAFLWPPKLAYGFTEKGGVARLRFPEATGFDATRLAAALPALAPKLEKADDAVTVVLAVPPGIRLHHYRAGGNVILDVIGKAQAPAKPPTTEKVARPGAAGPATNAPAPSAPIPLVPARVKAPAPATAAVTKPGSVAAPAVHYAAEGQTASLRFDWSTPTAAAVFRRAGALWIVFAAPATLDLAEPRERGGAMLGTIEQLPETKATVLRLVPRDGVNPSVRRAGTAWILDFKTQAAVPEAPVVVDARPSAQPPRVLLHVREAAEPLRLRDPVVGDTLLVVPVGELGRGIEVEQDLVDFRVLASVQGVVIRPNADDLTVGHTAEAIEITRPEGLALSSDADRLLGRAPDTLHRLFDFAAWRGPADESFVERRGALERAVAAEPAGARSKPRLDLARFYFANLFGAETLGVLAAIGRDDPTLAADPALRAMKGAACLMNGERDCAARELGLSRLDKEPEAVLWRASLAAEAGDPETAARDFAASVSLLPSYPKPLRNRMALEAAAAMLDTGQASASRPLTALVLEDEPAAGDKSMALYLEGRRRQQEGRLDQALELWETVARTGDRPSRARARYARAIALLEAGKKSRPETIKALDRLRFAWRGDAFEFTLLRRLGELELAEGDHRGGLQALREAAANFPDNAATKDVRKEMANAFADLFLGKGADDVPPLKALALYDEFHGVAPAGERGDAIVRKLVDRLVAVDLLDRAAALLDGQVQDRLTGTDKARAATQLALLRLLDRKPALALKALDVEIGHDVPAELARQRRQLRARAFAELDRPDDALRILAGDTSRDADRLRADIHWRARNWPEAAKTFARLVGTPPADGKLDGETGRLVLSWAAALTLAGDQAGLAKLRAGFGQAMAATPLADAFRVVAGTGAAGKGGDLREVASRIAQIGELQSFMASYKSRLADRKLSAIN